MWQNVTWCRWIFTKHNHPWIFGTSVFCLKKVNSSGFYLACLIFAFFFTKKPFTVNILKLLQCNVCWLKASENELFQPMISLCYHPSSITIMPSSTPEGRPSCCCFFWVSCGFFAFPVIVVFPSRRLLTLVAQHFAEAAHQTMAPRRFRTFTYTRGTSQQNFVGMSQWIRQSRKCQMTHVNLGNSTRNALTILLGGSSRKNPWWRYPFTKTWIFD